MASYTPSKVQWVDPSAVAGALARPGQTLVDHTLSVFRLVKRLEEFYGLDDDVVRLAQLAALFHDTGKLQKAFQEALSGQGETPPHAPKSAAVFLLVMAVAAGDATDSMKHKRPPSPLLRALGLDSLNRGLVFSLLLDLALVWSAIYRHHGIPMDLSGGGDSPIGGKIEDFKGSERWSDISTGIESVAGFMSVLADGLDDPAWCEAAYYISRRLRKDGNLDLWKLGFGVLKSAFEKVLPPSSDFERRLEIVLRLMDIFTLLKTADRYDAAGECPVEVQTPLSWPGDIEDRILAYLTRK